MDAVANAFRGRRDRGFPRGRRHPGVAPLLAWLTLTALPAVADEILVGAAVSLREPLTEIAELWEKRRSETRVRLSFAASSTLAAQIRAGAPLDVFTSADVRIVEALGAEGLLDGEGATFATNRLVVLVSRDAGAPLEGPADLLAPGLRRLAVPGGAVPVGRYAREWLRSRGLLSRLEPRLVRTEHARATLAAVDLGHADAAIVYATDARVARSARLAFEVAAAEQPRIEYAAALVAGARPGSAAFLSFLLGSGAQAVLRDAGFGTP